MTVEQPKKPKIETAICLVNLALKPHRGNWRYSYFVRETPLGPNIMERASCLYSKSRSNARRDIRAVCREEIGAEIDTKYIDFRFNS